MAQAKVVAEHPEKDVVYELLGQVCSGQKTMQEARAGLHRYVDGLDEDAALEWRKGARAKAEQLMRVAEGFLQELTVIGAGQ
jgi:hypothetical protein